MDEESKNEITWNSQLEKIISDEGEVALCYSWLHNRSEKLFSRLNTGITIPSIVLATLAGSTSMGFNMVFPNPTVANIVSGGITLSIGILTTVSNYFGWAKRTEGHRIASITYAKLHKFILIELALPRNERMTAKDMLKIVRDENQRLQETSPQIPDRIIAQFNKKFAKTTPEVKKPEITNGLDPIYVYPSDNQSPIAGRESMIDPMYRSMPTINIPDSPSHTTVIVKTSNDDRTPNKSQMSSSVRLPTSFEVDSSHI